jgi:hypothetical protein
MTASRKPTAESSSHPALPPPRPEATELASRLAALLEQHAGSVADVASASKDFGAAEQKLRSLRKEREQLRNPNAIVIARAVADITDAERALTACEQKLIEAEERRATIARDIVDVRGELEDVLTSQVRPVFDNAHSDFLAAVDSLAVSWIKLSAAAQAADLELGIRPSVESPFGHEILANPKILQPKIADAVGERWRSLLGVVNRARRVA